VTILVLCRYFNQERTTGSSFVLIFQNQRIASFSSLKKTNQNKRTILKTSKNWQFSWQNKQLDNWWSYKVIIWFCQFFLRIEDMLEPLLWFFWELLRMMNPKNNPRNHCWFIIVSDNCATLVVTRICYYFQ